VSINLIQPERNVVELMVENVLPKNRPTNQVIIIEHIMIKKRVSHESNKAMVRIEMFG